MRELELESGGVPLSPEAAVVGVDGVAVDVDADEIVAAMLTTFRALRFFIVIIISIHTVFWRVIVAWNLHPETVANNRHHRDDKSVERWNGKSKKEHEQPSLGFASGFDLCKRDHGV